MVRQVRAGYAISGLEIKVPQQYINRVMRATLVGSIAGTRQLNTMHFLGENDAPTLADVSAVANMILSWADGSYAPLVHESLTFEFVHVRGMNAYTTSAFTGVFDDVLGRVANDPLPYQVCGTVSMGTALTGHSAHGLFRAFTTGEVYNLTNGRPSDAYRTQLRDAILELMNASSAQSTPMCVASYTYRRATILNTATVNPLWGTLPSRKVGRGV